MLSGWFSDKKTVVLDKQESYLKIEFLTKEEKINKDITIESLIKQYMDDEDVIIPFE